MDGHAEGAVASSGRSCGRPPGTASASGRPSAQPGTPPCSHAGLLRKLIYFGYDPTRKSVVIGPTPLHGTAEAPPLLEYGGRARQEGPQGQERDWRRTGPRPFMGPAFEAEKPKLPAMWADSVK